MALLAGLVIAGLPDRAALTLAMVPSASISASFTTSTIRPQNNSEQIYFRKYFHQIKWRPGNFNTIGWNAHQRTLWEAISSLLHTSWSVLSAIGKIGFAQFCTFGRSQF